MEPMTLFLYGMAFGLLFGFAIGIALGMTRLKRIIRESKEGTKE